MIFVSFFSFIFFIFFFFFFFFFSSRRRHTRWNCDWSSDVCSSDLNFDKFDRAFGEYFKGIESVAGVELDVPLEWLLKQAELNLSAEEKAMIEAMGGWDKLVEALKKRLEEQKGRHQGGNKWIGTAGTSPFGAYGYNPEGVRIGQDKSRNRSAMKVWDAREYRNLDDSVELGTRGSSS